MITSIFYVVMLVHETPETPIFATRYECYKDMIEINHHEEENVDVKFNIPFRSSC